MPCGCGTLSARLAALMLRLVYVVGAAAVAVLAVATWPETFGLHRTMVIAQLTALRGVMVVTASSGAVLAGVLAWRFGTWRRFGVAAAVLCAVLAGANLTVMAARGFAVQPAAPATAADLTVFTWNTLGDAPGARLIAEFALQHGAHVLALPETSRATADEIARLMAEGGRPMQVFVVRFSDYFTQSTALLVDWSLGEYALDESVGSTPDLPSVVARSVNGDGPTLVSAHPMPPTPTRMTHWRAGLAWLADRCREQNVIVAGDLNSTLEHFHGLSEPMADLGWCVDGALVKGSAGLGTWPSTYPAFLGSPIDHILATEEWEFVEFRVLTELDGNGSDHRALLARLNRVP